MPIYFHDIRPCSQEQCKKKDQCYRYWLCKEVKGTGRQAVFYIPEKPITEGCIFFINKEYFE